jgi:hypothetical protein
MRAAVSRRARRVFDVAGAAIVVASLLCVSACANPPSGAASPQAALAVPMTPAGPWRTMTIDGDDKVMLEGHMPGQPQVVPRG